MSPTELKALREELKCTARELATALGLEQKEVLAWEAGELFPTKKYVTALEALRKKGPDAIPRKPRGKNVKIDLARLDDPKLWELVRKLCRHPTLFDATLKLAESYEDPSKPTE